MTTSSIRATSRGLVSLIALGAFCLVAFPTLASAQNNEAIAESLFLEGKQLYTDKQYAQACEKLAQSHKADPAGGTVLLLAMCYEQLGRTASAWAKYGEAYSMARHDGRQDRAQKSQESKDALTPQLARVTVKFEAGVSAPSGTELLLDEVAIPLLIDSKVPIDPGAHRLVVRAAGFEPWTHEFQISEPASLTTVEVPALKRAAPTLAPADPNSRTTPSPGAIRIESPPALEPRSSGATRTIGWIVGGVGLVTVGVGSYFAVKANSLDKKANDRCPNAQCIDSEAVSWNKDALRDANASTWLVGLGAAAMVTGGAMVLFGGSSGPQTSATAIVLPSGGAISLTRTY